MTPPSRLATRAIPGVVPAGTTGFGAVLRASRDPLRVVLFLAIILNISRVHQAFGFLKALRPGLVLVAIACGYAFLNPKYITRGKILNYWPMQRIALLGFLACCSAVFGLSLGRSANFILSNYSKTLVFAVLVALSIRDVSDLVTMVWAYAVSSSVLAYLALIVFGVTKEAASRTARLTDLYTYDANDVCVVMLVGLGCVLLLLQVATGKKRLLLLMMLVSIGGTIAKSGSRGGFIGLAMFAAASFVLINSVSVVSKAMLIGALVAGLAIFAPQGYWDQMSTILKPKEDYNAKSIDGRKALALRGLGYMQRYPVFGVGINNFDRAECTISGVNVGHGGIRCGAPHNSFVQAGSELGVPGVLVWSWLVLGGVFALIKLRSRLPASWKRGNDTERFLYSSTHFFALSLIGFAGSAFFVSFAWLDVLYVFTAIITGLYTSINMYKAGEAAARASGDLSGPLPVPVIPRGSPGWRVRSSAQRLATMMNGRSTGSA